MLSVLSRLPAYAAFRAFGSPRRLPLNLTLSLSYRCNSRCRTCNVHRNAAGELDAAEWAAVFAGLGRSPFWVTISGGEPFLRDDLVQIVCSLYDTCRPAIINIPTNGILRDRIPAAVERICRHCRDSRVVVNVSLDEVGEAHDAIRGVPGCYDKARATFLALRGLNLPNLSVGIHTVISVFNVARFPEVCRHLRGLDPDSYITEIAEERRELNTVGSGITPDLEQYAAAVSFLVDDMRRHRGRRLGRLTSAFRVEYYDLTRRFLRRPAQVIPCYSGFASAQIAPGGDVWMCCTEARSAGSLREHGLDFASVWFSPEADALRARIKQGCCACPLANASYTNMLFSPTSLARVAANLVRLP